MEKFIWHEENLPKGRKPERVHAVLVTKDGRMLLRYKNGSPLKVTGGHIDPEDIDMCSAVAREVLEEIDCKIDKCDFIGYLEYINEAENAHEIWARMVARVTEILPAQPDPACKDIWTYGRVLEPIEKAREEEVVPAELTEAMRGVLDAAIRAAQEKGYFEGAMNTQTEVLNVEEHIKR